LESFEWPNPPPRRAAAAASFSVPAAGVFCHFQDGMQTTGHSPMARKIRKRKKEREKHRLRRAIRPPEEAGLALNLAVKYFHKEKTKHYKKPAFASSAGCRKSPWESKS
jgi:hypothetical protein